MREGRSFRTSGRNSTVKLRYSRRVKEEFREEWVSEGEGRDVEESRRVELQRTDVKVSSKTKAKRGANDHSLVDFLP